MNAFLILTLASAACAMAIVIAWKTQRLYEQQRDFRREQLLFQSLRKVNTDLVTIRSLHLSDSQFEMELVLMNLRRKAEILMQALSAEAESGNRAISMGFDTPAGLEEWQGSRISVEQSQEVYNEALDAYYEFLHTLPPPLRAKAAERASFALQISPA